MSDHRPNRGDRVVAAEAVVAAALAAFEAQEWSRLVALSDVGSIDTLKYTLKTRYLHAKRTAEALPQFLEASGSAEGEVSEEFKEWARNRHRFGELAGVTTFEQLETLTPEVFIVRWAQARHPHYLVDGHSLWHPGESVQRREVIGRVALLPDTVAVVVNATETLAVETLGALSMIAVLGDNQGGWGLDAASGWLGIVDYYL